MFCLKQRGEVVFVKEMAGACGKFTTAESFEPPTLGDDGLMALIDLFAGREPLGRIYQRLFARAEAVGQAAPALPEFYDLVWLLNKHSVVLDSRLFKGMLGGVGGVAGP